MPSVVASALPFTTYSLRPKTFGTFVFEANINVYINCSVIFIGTLGNLIFRITGDYVELKIMIIFWKFCSWWKSIEMRVIGSIDV